MTESLTEMDIETKTETETGTGVERKMEMEPDIVMSKNIAIDLMGGDAHPDERFSALPTLLEQVSDLNFKVFVSKSYFNTIAHKITSFDKSRIEFVACERSVAMSESPFAALRQKRKSSMSMALRDVADGQSQICVTAGNTGAMVAFAKHWFQPMADIDKPSLSVLLPSSGKRSLLLDVGATVDARADDLYQFARLGGAFMQVMGANSAPEVALLNVGMEANKGDDTIRQADAMLEESDVNYKGFCEGSHLFSGFADVIVCNGLVGNIALKSCEAMAALIKQQESQSRKSFWQKFKKEPRIIEPDKYNGALLLGLDGLVVKSHGNCNSESFQTAVHQAANMAKRSLIEEMTALLENS